MCPLLVRQVEVVVCSKDESVPPSWLYSLSLFSDCDLCFTFCFIFPCNFIRRLSYFMMIVVLS